MNLPNDVIAKLGHESMLTLKDVYHIAASCKHFNSVLSPIILERIVQRRLKIAAFPRETYDGGIEWLSASTFANGQHYFYEFQGEATEIAINLDTSDEVALRYLCAYVTNRFPTVTRIKIVATLQCRDTLTDQLLAVLAGKATYVILGSCHSITPVGMATLKECAFLSVVDCLGVSNHLIDVYRTLVHNHSLLVVNNLLRCHDAQTVLWMRSYHLNGLLHVCWKDKLLME